ncbi:hypothetical protein Tco_0815373 [Tanacetum coccineum]
MSGTQGSSSEIDNNKVGKLFGISDSGIGVVLGKVFGTSGSGIEMGITGVTMSSATSDVTYTSVYTDSEPGRAFWGADYEEDEKEEEHLAPADSTTVIPADEPVFLPEGT